MSMPFKNMIIAIIMLLIGSGYLFLSLQLPDRSIQNVPGPAFFPNIVAGFILLLALALLIKSFAGLRSEPFFNYQADFPVRASAILAWFVLFLVMLPIVGFLVAAIPFFAGLMLLCDRRNPWVITASSVLIPVGLYFIFREAFSILLPTGQWG